MSRIPQTVPEKPIHADWWEPTETVTIKTYAGSYDQDRINAASVLRHPDNTTEFRPQERNLTKLELAIVSWTFTYDDGTEIPVNPTTLALLDERDRNYILAQFDEALASWNTGVGKTGGETKSEKKATFSESAV